MFLGKTRMNKISPQNFSVIKQRKFFVFSSLWKSFFSGAWNDNSIYWSGDFLSYQETKTFIKEKNENEVLCLKTQ